MSARLALVAALAPAAFLTAGPAEALPVVLSIEGAGTYFPGYSPVPTEQTMRIIATATDVPGGVQECDWALRGLAETLANGVGTWAGPCGPHTFTDCTFTRAGTDATLACPSGWAGKLVWVVDMTSSHEFTVAGFVATP